MKKLLMLLPLLLLTSCGSTDSFKTPLEWCKAELTEQIESADFYTVETLEIENEFEYDGYTASYQFDFYTQVEDVPDTNFYREEKTTYVALIEWGQRFGKTWNDFRNSMTDDPHVYDYEIIDLDVALVTEANQ